ncbi:BLUF domain-containing protein [Frateuria soli]|uniref:BLUF domain-containing protein n=1 Tax=Frateuria soli TaxID=1542730 RepID=UPI001E5F019C|nr:BLUF domain-containing protein [Frateuria soli]UGB37208.1 BLUF domain-containing protein [Frateuria soli]
MPDLVQIIYISRSTFAPMPAERGIEPSVARILAQSRINNARRGLVGALYFGDGCFFQCLEGRADAVDALCAALLRDPRHTDLRVLERRAIERTSFSEWSMKYVPLDAPMRALLRRRGLARFDPYQFDRAAVAMVLDMLRTGSDVATEPASGMHHGPAAPGRWIARRAPWALALLAAAVAAGLAWMQRP